MDMYIAGYFLTSVWFILPSFYTTNVKCWKKCKNIWTQLTYLWWWLIFCLLVYSTNHIHDIVAMFKLLCHPLFKQVTHLSIFTKRSKIFKNLQLMLHWSPELIINVLGFHMHDHMESILKSEWNLGKYNKSYFSWIKSDHYEIRLYDGYRIGNPVCGHKMLVNMPTQV